MLTLLLDTCRALNYYGKNPDLDVVGVVYRNDEENRWERFNWNQFAELANNVILDINIYEFIGRRFIKPDIYVVGAGWYLKRTGPEHNFEGWLFFNGDFDISSMPVMQTHMDPQFVINDLPAAYSDFINDEAFENSQYDGPLASKHYGDGVTPIVVGTDGRVYFSNHIEQRQHHALLWNPHIVNMVLSDEYKDANVFNNNSLSRLLGMDDARYYDNGVGSLTVTYVPGGHFTVFMGNDNNEQIHMTVKPIYNGEDDDC